MPLISSGEGLCWRSLTLSPNLQMTVRTTHPIKAAAVQRMRAQFPSALKGRKVLFVPEDVASNFKQQPFHTLAGTVMDKPPMDVSQGLLTVRLTQA